MCFNPKMGKSRHSNVFLVLIPMLAVISGGDELSQKNVIPVSKKGLKSKSQTSLF